MENIQQLESLVLGDFRPDFTIILDLPVEQGLERAQTRSEKDRFEREGTEFFERVRSVFHDRAESEPDRYCIIDTSPSLKQVQAELHKVLSTRIFTD